MDKWIVYLFGINRLNLYGWIVAGSVLIVACMGLAGASFVEAGRDIHVGILLMLGTIALLLLGILCVLLQMYCALYAEKLEKKDALLSQLNESHKISGRDADSFDQAAREPGRDQFAAR